MSNMFAVPGTVSSTVPGVVSNGVSGTAISPSWIILTIVAILSSIRCTASGCDTICFIISFKCKNAETVAAFCSAGTTVSLTTTDLLTDTLPPYPP